MRRSTNQAGDLLPRCYDFTPYQENPGHQRLFLLAGITLAQIILGVPSLRGVGTLEQRVSSGLDFRASEAQLS